MGKPPDIIEGKFAVVGERQPFWGPGLSFCNVGQALMAGLTTIRIDDPEKIAANPWPARIIFFVFIVIIGLARAAGVG